MALYGLTAAQVFREPHEDSKALVAWGPNMIVVAFRGTASLANVFNDIQVRAEAPALFQIQMFQQCFPCKKTTARISCWLYWTVYEATGDC